MNNIYSYAIESDDPKINGHRKRAEASNTQEALDKVRAKFTSEKGGVGLKSLISCRLVDLIMMDGEKPERPKQVSPDSHTGYACVVDRLIMWNYVHYDTAMGYVGGGIVVPYKIAIQKYRKA